MLVFRDRLWMAAAGWGILAVGDGMAVLVGQAAGGPRLPWNARKGWAGFAAFVVFGAAAAAFLAAWTARLPLAPDAAHWPRTSAWRSRSPSCAPLVESLPTTLDDNVTVPARDGARAAAARRGRAGAAAASDPGFTRRLAGRASG